MYERYWKLKEKPFSNTPNPRYLYMSRLHEEALMRLFYAVKGRVGGVLLTGDYGCGKTLLSRVLLRELSPLRYEMALLSAPSLGPTELLSEILYQFGAPVRASLGPSELRRALGAFLRSCDESGRHPVVVLDEAQMLLSDSLEEARLLLNFQRDDRFLLTLVFMGQPELKPLVTSRPQLRQRLVVRCHLGPLSQAETVLYMRHRLRVAGAEGPIFTRGAEEAVFAATAGVPREVNSLCDLSLLVGAGRGADSVGPELVRDVAEDLAA